MQNLDKSTKVLKISKKKCFMEFFQKYWNYLQLWVRLLIRILNGEIKKQVNFSNYGFFRKMKD